jgi:hypothetical protein
VGTVQAKGVKAEENNLEVALPAKFLAKSTKEVNKCRRKVICQVEYLNTKEV